VKVLRLDRADLDRWLSRWLTSREVYAPRQEALHTGETKSYCDWGLVTEGPFPEPPPGVPKNSVKRFFSPQPEVLQTFTMRPEDPDASILRAPARASHPRVLIGVRPCDARSSILNGLPFADDPYYQCRREETAMVGLTCGEKCRTCFCTWVGGSPYGTEGLDIALTQTDEGYVAEIITVKGEQLAEEGGGGPEASGALIAKIEELRRREAAAAKSVRDPADTVKKKDLMALYDAAFWGEIADRCINCGACTFLCPTCYCFDIQDEVVKGTGRRIRCWDSCMFPLFTLHASGHNPRGQKTQRVRNRFMHKLKYFPDRFGPLSCVGCGRCIRECPVNIDIREVLRDLLPVE
jgi:sulfhydrogenase subunit beta (sulfur reductase)